MYSGWEIQYPAPPRRLVRPGEKNFLKQHPLRAADGHRSASNVIINKLSHALTLCGSALEICLLDLILTRVPGYSRRRNMGVWVSWICKPGFRQLMQFEERLVAWLSKFIEIFQLPHPIHCPSYIHQSNCRV